MKTNSNLPEPTLEKRLVYKLKQTAHFVSSVFFLTKKVFMF
jgi:hypothetical protein